LRTKLAVPAFSRPYSEQEEDSMSRIFTIAGPRGARRAALVLAVAASLSGTALAPWAVLADTGGATIYFDKTSCLGSGSTNSGTVAYTRDGKTIDVDVSLTSGWSDGQHGVLLFVLTPNGSCPSSGQFLGFITTSGGSGSNSFAAKIQPARGSHDITVVLCLGDLGPHFSGPVSLSP
jgi:hypothetical protein